ncbi:porin [Pedobacter duraquae]|uniref:Phosphate-selective porin O/P n=1 Tax=Pedobacter duraquae TaxID=425511 RepID=A0A4R6IBV8_9SPHI|nr:porin [Pedobacter duraquae]TDO19304.1 phosphate-selective porin O/P [Pedobacter duraquae]
MKISKTLIAIHLLFLLVTSTSFAQQTDTVAKAPKWYDTFSIRGYAQLRYNRLLETNPELKNEQGDKSWGDNGGLFLRRIRLVFYGQISKRVYFYLQPDFATAGSSGNLNFGQLRDAYFDLGLDDKNEFRIRLGQSKIPYGFENMQSSQNRLPMDRADGTNSAFVNERDLGAFFYWAPKKIRARFDMLVKQGLKGSGDYGVFAFGLFNGQTANKPEANNQQHWVTRFTYPIAIGKQIVEASIQGYTGAYNVTESQTSKGVKVKADRNYLDQRVAASFILYPQPFGIQAEYNVGKGPTYNKATDSIEVKNLNGGYVTLSYLTKIKKQVLIPFARAHYYNGGKKHELDARAYDVKELEIGLEWQPVKQFELVCQYTMSSRRFEDHELQDNLQKGNLLRLQAQVNF